MIFNKAKAGLFRSNPHASNENSLRLGNTDDADVVGTPAEDTGNFDTAGKTLATGIKYTGKDGVNKFYEFFRTENLTHQRLPITVAIEDSAEGAQRLQDAVHNVIRSHEVDSIVSITKGATTTIDAVHVGSGTLTAIVIDGADEGAFSRAAVVVSVGVTVEQESKPLSPLQVKSGKRK